MSTSNVAAAAGSSKVAWAHTFAYVVERWG